MPRLKTITILGAHDVRTNHGITVTIEVASPWQAGTVPASAEQNNALFTKRVQEALDKLDLDWAERRS